MTTEELPAVKAVIFEQERGRKKNPKPWKLFAEAAQYFKEHQDLVPLRANYDNTFEDGFKESLLVEFE